MKTRSRALKGWLTAVVCLSAVVFATGTRAAALSLEDATILGVKGKVDISRSGSNVWDPAQTNLVLRAGDGLRSGESSRATLRLRDATILNIAELTRLRVEAAQGRSVVDLLQGVLSFFHRDKPGDVEVRAGGASAIVRGTEFVARVPENGELEIVLFDGAVDVSNRHGTVSATSGDLVNAAAGSIPTRTTGIAANNREAIQWTLYYPMVLDPADLALDAKWKEAIRSYQSGDAWSALEAARTAGNPATDDERLFLAALELAVGDVPAMEDALSKLTASGKTRLAEALRNVVRAAQREPCDAAASGDLSATELLARSYCLQSKGDLGLALEAAERAAAKSPGFASAHARVGELLFAHGRARAATDHISRAVELAPRLAAAYVTRGFLEAAAGRFAQARSAFDHALALDPAIGDAWLGRGLVRFNRGDREGGRIDIETAAALEPNRSVLRSYLGKAFAEERNHPRATAELERAKELDPQDPTAWLYSALVRFRGYDLSGAIGDLGESGARNKNRAIFRSGMLLDQDAAVRSANLANIYEMADMSDVARRESARAVMFDYSNFSAHLNLASSFNVLRDPTRFNLRNESVWFNEHLLASLLAPTESAPLSQTLSQNEYSRLFARNRVGFTSSTEYISDREEVRQLATQFGNFDRFSYALDLDSAWMEGNRPNSDLERIEWYSRAKIDVTQQDSVLLMTKHQDFESGDNYQYLNPASANPNIRLREEQSPLVFAGYHREWHPGSHTLVLGGRLENEQSVNSARLDRRFATTTSVSSTIPSRPFRFEYTSEFEIYSGELNHILESERHTTILGGRIQAGDFESRATLTPLQQANRFAGSSPISTGNGDFERESVYAYHTWEIVDDLRLTGGIAFDDITSPANFRRAPLQSGEIHRNHWSPKAALIYSPLPMLTVRGMYAESLGGVSYDQSVTLEPTQLAGFPQTFRTLISESVAGSVELPRHDVGGLALDLRFPTRTYISVEALDLRSDVRRRAGYYLFDARTLRAAPATLEEWIDYTEQSAGITVNQIIGREWFAQLGYQYTEAEIRQTLFSIPPRTYFDSEEAKLHRAGVSLLYQRRDGLFARAAFTYLRQEWARPGASGSEDLPLVDLFIGWRFPRHYGDLTLGVLNLGNSDYRLSPLTQHEDFVRGRSFYLRFRLNL